jgi:hypothetical protein
MQTTTKPSSPAPASNQANMNLLPLHSFLNIPSEGLKIVVDNAMSPQKSISFRLQSQHKKRLHVPSSDSKPEDACCSAVTLPPLMMPEDAMEPCKEGNVLRAFGVHDKVDCCSTSTDEPMEAPAQQESHKDLAKDNTSSLSQLLPEEVDMAKPTQEKQGMVRTRSRSLSLNSKSTFMSNHSNYMMSVEALRPSRSLDFLPVFVEHEFQGMTTTELIEKALENVSDL